MLCAGNEAFYVFEPFDVAKDAGLEGPRWMPRDLPYMFYHIPENSSSEYEPALRRAVELRYPLLPNLARIRTPRHCGRLCKDWLFSHHARLTGKRPLLKDPIALFSVEWLARTFDMKVVVMIRHPAGFASSIKRLNWHFNFENFIGQEALMDGLLAPYKDQIFEYARHPRDIIDQAILVWNAMYSAVRRYRETHPDWHFVTHERLSADPSPNSNRSTTIAASRGTPAPRPSSPRIPAAATRATSRPKITGPSSATARPPLKPGNDASRKTKSNASSKAPARSRPISTARRSSMPAEPATLRRSIACSGARDGVRLFGIFENAKVTASDVRLQVKPELLVPVLA